MECGCCGGEMEYNHETDRWECDECGTYNADPDY